jgi:hypothetical protein
MRFPFKEICLIMNKANQKFRDVNSGGCGMMAYILARQLSKITKTRTVVCGYGGGDLKVARSNVNDNNINSWYKQNIKFTHVWVEFLWNKRWYAIDIKGIKPRKQMYGDSGRWSKPYDGSFTLKEIKELAHDDTYGGWSSCFQRDQIPYMKKMINKEFNQLFN